MSIRVVGDAQIIERFKAVGNGARERLLESIGRSVLRLQTIIRAQKLTGQVLKVRTGTLRRSIDTNVMERGAEVVGVVSTNVEYAKKHEYGFTGSETVKAHMRDIKQAWGKPLREPKQVQVTQHTRTVDYAARSFMRTALAEQRESIVNDMRQSVLGSNK